MNASSLVAFSLLAGPGALACTFLGVTAMPGLDGATDVPLNAQLLLGAVTENTSVFLVDEDAESERELRGEAILGVQLAPNTSHRMVGPLGVVRFHSGDAIDTEPPPAPVALVVEEQPLSGTCGDGAMLTIRDVDGPGGALAVVDDTGRLGLGGVDEAWQRVERDARPAELRVVAVDLAGNISEPVVVEVPAGCAQTSTSTAMALALVGLLLARRRGRSERR
jgi:hypothetical protein